MQVSKNNCLLKLIACTVFFLQFFAPLSSRAGLRELKYSCAIVVSGITGKLRPSSTVSSEKAAEYVGQFKDFMTYLMTHPAAVPGLHVSRWDNAILFTKLVKEGSPKTSMLTGLDEHMLALSISSLQSAFESPNTWIWANVHKGTQFGAPFRPVETGIFLQPLEGGKFEVKLVNFELGENGDKSKRAKTEASGYIQFLDDGQIEFRMSGTYIPNPIIADIALKQKSEPIEFSVP